MKKIAAITLATLTAFTVIAAGGCRKKPEKQQGPAVPDGVTLSKVENGDIAATFSDFAEKYAESGNIHADFTFEENYIKSASAASGTRLANDYKRINLTVKYIDGKEGKAGVADAKALETATVRKDGGYDLSSPDYAKYNYSERSLCPQTAKLRGDGLYLYSNGSSYYKNDELQYTTDGLRAYYNDFVDFGQISCDSKVLVMTLGTDDIFTTLQPVIGSVVSSISGGQSVKIADFECPADKVTINTDIRADETKLYINLSLGAKCEIAGISYDYFVKTALYLDAAHGYTMADFKSEKPSTSQTSSIRYLDLTGAEFYDRFFKGEPLGFELKGGGDLSGAKFVNLGWRVDFNYSYDGVSDNTSVNYLYDEKTGVFTFADNAFEVFKSGLGVPYEEDKLDYIYCSLELQYSRTVGNKLFECRSVMFLYYE